MRKLILTLSLMSLGLTSFTQEFRVPAPSPIAKVSQDFSTSTIQLQYSRPSLKGRKMLGNLVPYNTLWRTGANQIPVISFEEPVYWGDKMVPPGSYALATIPGEKEWLFILYKNTNSWGINDLKDEDIIAKAKATVQHLSIPQETFEIKFDNISNNSLDLIMSWENIEARTTLKVDNFDLILENLKKTLDTDDPQYLALARFYYEHDYELEKALEYINSAIKTNPEAFWMQWAKAQILNKLGKKEEALKAAQTAADLTKGTAYENEYAQHLNSIK